MQTHSSKRFNELLKDEKKAKALIRSWDAVFCDEGIYDAVRKNGYKLFMKRRK
jgi:hypothetical protein